MKALWVRMGPCNYWLLMLLYLAVVVCTYHIPSSVDITSDIFYVALLLCSPRVTPQSATCLFKNRLILASDFHDRRVNVT